MFRSRLLFQLRAAACTSSLSRFSPRVRVSFGWQFIHFRPWLGQSFFREIPGAKSPNQVSRALASSSSTSNYPKFNEADAGLYARDLFADTRFYDLDEEVATASAKARKKHFRDMTVQDLIEMWNGTEEQKKEAGDKIRLIGAIKDAIESYLSGGTTIEMLLHGRIIALNASNEVNVVNRCFVDLEATRKQAGVVAKRDHNRIERIAYVLGPSGSGKTVCALKQVSTYGWTEATTKYTTLYLKISQLDQAFQWDGEEADAGLLAWVQNRLTIDPDLKRLYKASKKLRMHVAIVLDEAGSKGLLGFFEKKTQIYSLYKLLGSLVEDEFELRLIVAGTGLTTKHLIPGKDVDKIRLDAWSREDFAKVANERFGKLNNEAIAAIYRQSMLAGLTTNARSAWYLLMVVSSDIFLVPAYIKYSVRGNWDRRLGAGLPTIVEYVVDNYASMNGLNDLDPCARRLWRHGFFMLSSKLGLTMVKRGHTFQRFAVKMG
jgi:hypothetical protein